jgi:hypothetical protein
MSTFHAYYRTALREKKPCEDTLSSRFMQTMSPLRGFGGWNACGPWVYTHG